MSAKASPGPQGKATVENLHESHSVRAADWRSPLAFRLLGSASYSDSSRTVSDSFRPPGAPAPQAGEIELSWSGLKKDFDLCLKTYQAHTLTEFAALGLACVLVRHRALVRIVEVTRRGERADYWVGEAEGDKSLLLEVAGRQECDLDELCAEKARQLRDNPYGKPGYVCVVEFQDATARLWFFEGGDA